MTLAFPAVAPAAASRNPRPAQLVVAAASSALRGVAPGFAVAEPPGGPRFPNGYLPVTGSAVACRPGGHRLRTPVAARRWWDPDLPVGPLDEALVARFHCAVEPITLPQPPEDGIGWGPGLTPAGDDVVVGMLLAFRAAGDLASVAELAAAGAGRETTPLSRSLLDHAARGQAARPVLDLFAALAGRGSLDAALAGLRRFGASSGHHLIEGVRRALLAAQPTVADGGGGS